GPAGARVHDSVSGFGGLVLQRFHRISGIRAEQRRMESDGTGALRTAGSEAGRVHQSRGGTVSGSRKEDGDDRDEFVRGYRRIAGRAASGRKRNRRAAQKHRVRRPGTVRIGNDERGAAGSGENALPEFVPSRRSGAEFEGEREDSGVWTGRQDFRTAGG